MASPRVAARPDDPRLRYSGYVRRVEVSATRARFDRVYGSLPLAAHGPATAQQGSLHLSWRSSTASPVSVAVEYTSACSERCCPDLDLTCYPQSKCRTQCRLRLQVDGRPVAAPGLTPAAGFERGVHHLELPPGDGQPHEYTLLWPWGAAIDLLGLSVADDAWQSLGDGLAGGDADADAFLLPPPPPSPPPLRLVAHGDSITHGFCGQAASYPEQLAELNGWEAVNLGIQGLTAADARAGGHGETIAALAPDLATLMIGVNDAFYHAAAEVGADVDAIVGELRARRPVVPLALITPLAATSASDKTLVDRVEVARAQVRRIAAARRGGGDGRLVVVEGVPLLPLELFVEGLHPTTRGYAELARNLNAALGFSPVAVAVDACAPLVLRVRGLTPRGRYALYHARDRGAAAAGHVADECAGRAMMVPRGGREEGIADAGGAATVTLAAARCDDTAWQALDLRTCASSAVGRGADAAPTLAAMLPARPPPPPPAGGAPPPDVAAGGGGAGEKVARPPKGPSLVIRPVVVGGVQLGPPDPVELGPPELAAAAGVSVLILALVGFCVGRLCRRCRRPTAPRAERGDRRTAPARRGAAAAVREKKPRRKEGGFKPLRTAPEEPPPPREARRERRPKKAAPAKKPTRGLFGVRALEEV